MLKIGKIVGFRGSYMSGLATLVFEDSQVHCENAPTVRALENCFGNTIGHAHNVREDAGFIGQEIVYEVDDFGLLKGFVPADELSEEQIQQVMKEAEFN